MTIGIIVHSTRSGSAAIDRRAREYEGTIAWFAKSTSQVSAHRVIGYFEGQHALCVPDDMVAWHAGEHNAAWLGVELAQSLPTDEYSDWQYEELARLCREWGAKYGLALDREHIKGHDEMPQGIHQGKSDPGIRFDWGRLMGMLNPLYPLMDYPP